MEKFNLFYFLLNDTRFHLVLDYTCILRLISYAPLKNSRFGRLVNLLCLVVMAITGSHIVSTRFISAKLFIPPDPETLESNRRFLEFKFPVL